MKIRWQIEVNGMPKVGNEEIGITLTGEVDAAKVKGVDLLEVVHATVPIIRQKTPELQTRTGLQITIVTEP